MSTSQKETPALPLTSSQATSIESCIAVICRLAETIKTAVNEGKSVTVTNKKLIALASDEIRIAVSKLPSLTRTSCDGTPGSDGPPSYIGELKEEIIASVKTEVQTMKDFVMSALCEDEGDGFTLVTNRKAKRRTYAATAQSKPSNTPLIDPPPNNNRYTLLLESVDPRQTSEDVLKEVKEQIDVIDLGIGISGIRKTKTQKVAITCDTAEDRGRLKDAIKSQAQRITATEQALRKPLIKFIGITADTTDTKLIEAIKKQNQNITSGLSNEDMDVKVARRIKGRTEAVANVVIEVGPGLWRAMKDTKIKVGYQVVPAQDQSPVVQCYKCLGYGHKANNCTAETRCGYCSEDHDTRSCPRKEKTQCCVNCISVEGKCHDHPAYSQSCPEWQKWDRIARLATRYC